MSRLRSWNECRRSVRRAVEALESRVLLSVAPLSNTHKAEVQSKLTAAEIKAALKEKATEPIAFPTKNGVTLDSGVSTAGATGAYSASQLLGSYGIDQVQDDGGTGAGQTIAIIDAYNDPSATTDMATFDAAMGLPAPPNFWIVGQTGGAVPATNGNTQNPSTTVETSLDIEWAHAVAPKANILLVECNSLSYGDLIEGGVAWAETQNTYPNVTTVSMSFGGPDSASLESALNSYFTTPAGHAGITFLASTGDSGATDDGSSAIVNYPAASPNVVAVGGTTFEAEADDHVYSEVAWGYGSGGSLEGTGGGVSTTESEPSYQTGTVTASGRAIPDVSFDADPETGVAICDSNDYGVGTPWAGIGGTSLSAPCWAGMISIVDQQRVNNGLSSLDGATQTLPMLYNLPSTDFRDITYGNNGIYYATAGYDFTTGRGSPIADKLLSDLSGQTAGPDLTFSTPTGWSSPLVVTPTSGGTTDGLMQTGSTLYVDWNGVNVGASATTASFHTRVIVDGTTEATYITSSVASGATFGVSGISIGSLTAGTHTITVQLNYLNEQSESNTTNDTYTRVINVLTTTAANIEPYTPLGWSAPVVITNTSGGTTDTTLTTSNTVYLDFALANFGSTAASQFFVTLTFNGESLGILPLTSLPSNTYADDVGVSLGTLAAGTYTIGLLNDYNQAIPETNYFDNDYTATFTVTGSTGTITGTVFQDDNSDGSEDGSDFGLAGQTVYLDLNNDGKLDVNDLYTTTTSNGSYTFSNVPVGSYTLREVTPVGYVQTSPSSSYSAAVTNSGTVSGENFGNFPITYTGTSGNDSYTVQLDPTALTLQILVGATLTYSAPKSIVPSLSFSLGAGDDTLIVNGVNGNPIPSGGIAYNGGTHVSGDTLQVLGSSGSDSFTANAGQVLYGSSPINYSNVQNVIIDPKSGTDSLAVNAGTVTLPAQTTGGGILTRTFSSLSVASGATLIVGTNAASHPDRTLVVASSLSVSSTGTLNLGGNDMIVHSGALSTINGLLATGYAGGAWTGLGIDSSAAAADATKRTALGVLLNSGSVFASFDGQAVSATDVLVKYTYYGDANLDGVVNGSDYTLIDNGFNNNLSGWQNGDFNYDGHVNGSDYTIIDNAFNNPGPPL